MFRQKFWGTLLLSIATVIWAPMIQHGFGFEAPGGPVASRWIPALFGTLVFGYGGWVFIQGAVNEIRDRLPGMMTLISLAISVAFGFSLAVADLDRTGLLDVLATCGRTWSGVTGHQWDGIQEVEGSTPFGSTLSAILALRQLNRGGQSSAFCRCSRSFSRPRWARFERHAYREDRAHSALR